MPSKPQKPTLGERVDLRDLDLVTIDGADARDFDDAVWADPEPLEGGGFRAVVAIADVAHYVQPGDPLDKEALERGNSVYFPDRVIPMLPEALSNGLCSLKPLEDRASIAVELIFDADANLKRWRFMRALIKSRARLTYEQVQMARDGSPDDRTGPLMATVIDAALSRPTRSWRRPGASAAPSSWSCPSDRSSWTRTARCRTSSSGAGSPATCWSRS